VWAFGATKECDSRTSGTSSWATATARRRSSRGRNDARLGRDPGCERARSAMLYALSEWTGYCAGVRVGESCQVDLVVILIPTGEPGTAWPCTRSAAPTPPARDRYLEWKDWAMRREHGHDVLVNGSSVTDRRIVHQSSTLWPGYLRPATHVQDYRSSIARERQSSRIRASRSNNMINNRTCRRGASPTHRRTADELCDGSGIGVARPAALDEAEP